MIFDRHRVIFAGDVMVKPKNNPRIAAVVNSAARQVMVVNGRRVVVERVRSAVMLENQRRSRVCRVSSVEARVRLGHTNLTLENQPQPTLFVIT